MSLTPGARIGVYEIVGLIGAGGMGEVYRARDARLHRDVAIKVLPEAFANDAERLARFQREAQMLASLNHPHIASIYGFEESGGVRGLVLELVEGPTLADRIAQGAIPLEEALPIARQIADALEAAHEQGVIHRDLKPANIKLTRDGNVKVLDFGLAKAMDASAVGRADMSLSPTITSPAMTMGGVILGTAAYMSPEQAKGKALDKRSDIWAFGSVLFEMLTGKRAFDGEDVTDTIVSVLSREPDWAALPANTPAALKRVLRRSLEKDRRARLSDIADARLEIEEARQPQAVEAVAGSPAATGRRGRERMAWLLAGVGLISCAVLGAMLVSRTEATSPLMQFQMFPAPGSAITAGLPEEGGSPLAVSPDGTRIVFVATTATGANALWLRPLSAMTALMIPGTAGASSPFWKPDGSEIGFFADRKLKRISASGGPAFTICDAFSNRNGTWGRDGVIVFSPINSSPIHRVSEDGGTPTPITKLESNETGHLRPTFLPDGRHFLFSAFFAGQTADVPIYLSSTDSPQRKLIVKSDTANIGYALGHVLFMRESTLMAQRFDERRLEANGDPFPVVENVRSAMTPGFGVYSVSNDGVLAYQTGSGGNNATRVRWVDREGKELEQISGVGDFVDLDLSPDGKFAAITSLEPGQRSPDIWIYDLSRRSSRTRLTSSPFSDLAPVWSAGSTAESVYFVSRSNTAGLSIYRQRFNGGAQELVHEPGTPRSVSPDGTHLLFTQVTPGKSLDLFVLPLSSGGKPVPFVATPATEAFGQFSPDGKWIAYETNEQQRMEVFVARFPSTGAKWLVSTAGGIFPRWRKDGKEIFYISSGKLMAAAVITTSDGIRVSEPQPLFDLRTGRTGYPYAVSNDGKRFLVASFDQATPEPISVITNWLALRAH